jgi:hypothetical protein
MAPQNALFTSNEEYSGTNLLDFQNIGNGSVCSGFPTGKAQFQSIYSVSWIIDCANELINITYDVGEETFV